jgi:hypothetical protein
VRPQAGPTGTPCTQGARNHFCHGV